MDDLKTRLVRALSNHAQITAREAHRLVVVDNYNVTYQAVHKTLRQMSADGMVIQTGPRYALSEEYRNQSTGLFSQITYGPLQGDFNFTQLKEGQTQYLVFPNLHAFPFLMLDYLLQADVKRVTNCWFHLWPVTIIGEYIQKQVDVCKKIRYEIYYNEGGATGEFLEKAWRDIGAKVYKSSWRVPSDYMVFDDYVAQIYWPCSMKIIANKLYHLPPGKSLNKMAEFIFKSPLGRVPVPISITRSKNLANSLRGYFEKY